MIFLGTDCKIAVVEAAAANGTSALTSDIVDMAGWDSVLFLVTTGTPAADNLMKLQQDTDSAGATMADLEGSEVNLAGASDDTQWIDLHTPRERYVRAIFTRGTSTLTGPIYAIQYNRSGTLPYDNTTTGTIAGQILVAPAEGTA